MTLVGFLILLLIAAICGGIGQSIAGYSMGGCIMSIIVGFLGAWLGLWIADEFRLPLFWVLTIGGKPFPVIWSIIGSTLFAAIIGFVGRAMKGD